MVLCKGGSTVCNPQTMGFQGRSQGGAQGAFAPTFFPESCNIYNILPFKCQYQVVTVLFRIKNHHRKADYKAICKQPRLNSVCSGISGVWWVQRAQNGVRDLISGCGSGLKFFVRFTRNLAPSSLKSWLRLWILCAWLFVCDSWPGLAYCRDFN